MAKITENCGNCAWRAQQTKWIETRGIAIDVPALELLFRCALENILHSLADSCLCWMGFYGDPLQLDYFGVQEFGSRYTEAYEHQFDNFTSKIHKPSTFDLTEVKLRLPLGGLMYGPAGRLHQMDCFGDQEFGIKSEVLLFDMEAVTRFYDEEWEKTRAEAKHGKR